MIPLVLLLTIILLACDYRKCVKLITMYLDPIIATGRTIPGAPTIWTSSMGMLTDSVQLSSAVLLGY